MAETDLISRQAAIDALNGEINITGRANAEAVRGYVRLVKDRLERLPSAQPKERTEERAETHACDLIDRQAAIDAVNNLTYPSSLVDVKRILVDLPSAQPEQRWIPCSERLPKENGHYLVTFHQTATEEDLGFDMDDTDVRKMRYDTKHGWRTPRRIPSWINDAVVSTVLAWMPLPEAWKGEHDG